MNKRTLNIIFWTISLPLIIILLGMVSQQEQERRVQDFQVDIEYQGGDYLFTSNDIEKQVLTTFDSLEGKPLADVRESDIELEIENNPYVLNAEVYTTIDGLSKAVVWQRKTILQLIDSRGKCVYVDENGVLMPGGESLPARVPVANGNFDLDTINPDIDDILIEELNNNRLNHFFKIAKVIYNDEFLCAIVEQIYNNKNNEYEIITKLGQHSVLIGTLDELEHKMEKLKIFYQNANARGGWKKYDQLNLKYKNQVIGNKK
ncbi:MAG: cell division protein FtsQ/DivIB [Bacteroidales bacterium]